jgi:dTMP kinase
LTLEGPDGSGKSTQARRLAGRLADEGHEAVLTREPGGTALGEEIRQILLHGPTLDPAPATDALLFNAARAQLVARVIAPALARGAVVICDRFADSTLAYQGHGSGQPLDDLRALAAFATGGLNPDLTVLFDLPVEEGLRRKGAEVNRFEVAADVAFHQRVREGFLAIAAASPDRFLVVDATHPADDIEAEIFAELVRRLAARPDAVTSTDASVSRRSEPKGHSVRMDR